MRGAGKVEGAVQAGQEVLLEELAAAVTVVVVAVHMVRAWVAALVAL